MQELSVITKAREFINVSGIDTIPVDIEQYASAANAKIEVRDDLVDEESGQSFPFGSSNIIIVNGNHREERQRFTVLHEIAHIVLKLPSNHNVTALSTSHLMSYRSRPKEEILCDVFAAECLLPYEFFKKDVDGVEVSFSEVKKLAKQYKASITSTGSRFALNCDFPCAFVLMEQSKIRYVSMSKFLRELNGWIEFGVPIPKGSVAERLLIGDTNTQDYDEIPTDIWFNNRVDNFQFLAEEAILFQEWNQCLSLIWFEDDFRVTSRCNNKYIEDDELLLEELDGILPWPSKKRRK